MTVSPRKNGHPLRAPPSVRGRVCLPVQDMWPLCAFVLLSLWLHLPQRLGWWADHPSAAHTPRWCRQPIGHRCRGGGHPQQSQVVCRRFMNQQSPDRGPATTRWLSLDLHLRGRSVLQHSPEPTLAFPEPQSVEREATPAGTHGKGEGELEPAHQSDSEKMGLHLGDTACGATRESQTSSRSTLGTNCCHGAVCHPGEETVPEGCVHPRRNSKLSGSNATGLTPPAKLSMKVAQIL